jgi:saxitoxin biosynthesis operon SxtJ-like protein
LGVPTLLSSLAAKVAGMPLRGKIVLGLFVVVLTVETICRRYAPKSRFYQGWKATFEAIGAVWTAVLLSLVYVVSVGLISIVNRLLGKDPLDRAIRAEPTFWRAHEPNPLGPRAAVRHQF